MKSILLVLMSVYVMAQNSVFATEIRQCWKSADGQNKSDIPHRLCIDQIFISFDLFRGAKATLRGVPYSGDFQVLKKSQKSDHFEVEIPLLSKVIGGGCSEVEIQDLSLNLTIDRFGNILNPDQVSVKADYLLIPDGCHASHIPQPVDFIRD